MIHSRVCCCAFLLVAITLMLSSAVHADPCGMVPPVFVDDVENLPIKRIGPQKTYVFYKNGLETFIIRPGYEGRVDEFGMLIPFPVPPAIKKAPDNFFDQLAAAIDPPEIVIDLTPRPTGAFFGGGLGGGGGFGGGGGLGFAAPAKDEVKVVREEAVGMYEVAVLAAGSAKALKKWLEEHEYQYPSGMDLVCNDYVDKRWCFVAVKTRVVAKGKADPEPGQREVDADLPEGSVFDGHVQAMEFRFPSRELVVPMRLSAFNEGETRNIVYLLADKPAKIRNIPEEYVMRQMSGDELYDNLTDPLPLRIIGGKLKDIPAATRRGLEARRNPVPHNGVAADIFTGDLLAAKSGTLLSEHEVKEKELVSIGEELDLRGEAFDEAIGRELANQRAAAKKAVLHHLKDMVLTVVDGEFPREVLAKDNLRFAEYEMPRRKSDPEFYDAKLMGPAGKQPGIRHSGSIDWGAIDRASRIASAEDSLRQSRLPHLESRTVQWVLLFGGIGLIVAAIPRGNAKTRFFTLIVTVALASWLLQSGFANGDEEVVEEETVKLGDAQISLLLRDLDNSSKARDAIDQLVTQGEAVTPRLTTIALRDSSLTRRGWAIAGLGRIGGEDAHETLSLLGNNKKQPEMIRIWASAAKIKFASTPKQFEEAVKLVQEHPSLERPLGKSIERQLAAGGEAFSVAGMLELCIRKPEYERILAKPIVAQGSEELVKQMLTNADSNVRRRAAGYVATAAQAGEEGVAETIADALAFDPEAKDVPWAGGPFFVPGIAWSASEDAAKKLAGSLIAWHVWCEQRRETNELKKININLGSTGLSGAAGYTNLGQRGVASERWVQSWQDAAGEEAVELFLEPQGLAFRDGKLIKL